MSASHKRPLRGSGEDAQILSTEFESLVPAPDITSMPWYQGYIKKLLVDDSTAKPFSVQSLPPPMFPHDDKR